MFSFCISKSSQNVFGRLYGRGTPYEQPTHPHEVMKLLLGIKEEALGRAVQEALDREPLKAG